jgi:mannosyl-3-phosphoglycerate phosphatase
MNDPQLIIYTDLDGTLLDAGTYSDEISKPLIKELQRQEIPLVFCSSKTRTEQQVYIKKFHIDDPFIAEGGSAIFVPKHCFEFSFKYDRLIQQYYIIELASQFSVVSQKIKEFKDLGLPIKSYYDMTPYQISALTNLDIMSAKKAKEREYQETVVLYGTADENERIIKLIKEDGFNVSSGGRFFGVSMGGDKGKAVLVLNQLYKRKFGQIKTVAIGDSLNDESMLREVDLAYLVKKQNGEWEDMSLKGLTRIPSIGPQGWKRAINSLIGKTENNLLS